MAPPDAATAWEALRTHSADSSARTIASLFEDEPGRFDAMALELDGLLLDTSKTRVTEETLTLLLDLARASGVESRRDAMFAGEAVNATEDRAALHTALRAAQGDGIADATVLSQVADARARVSEFAERLRTGAVTGATGQTIDHVVNIGIGGSHAGPLLITDALAEADLPLWMDFVANVDGADLESVLAGADPERILFVVVSKTFTTQETLANGEVARAWLIDALGEDAPAAHMAAVTKNAAAAAEFGMAAEYIFPVWDWVGGRFSLWSAVGLSAEAAIGSAAFGELLAGARAMDRHFAETPLEGNLPVRLALVSAWNTTVEEAAAEAVTPYGQRLRHLVPYLQQLQMESNGKDAQTTPTTSPVVFGDVGSTAQHAFFQQLHQGPAPVAVEFIAVAEPMSPHGDHHAKLLANCFAQSEALMNGSHAPADEPHRVFPGNRPSTTILLERLDARHLGMLLTLYEHKVFVQACLWGINPFDQWGVELGKDLAHGLLAGHSEAHPATAGLSAWARKRT